MLVNIQFSNHVSGWMDNLYAVENFIYSTKLYDIMLPFAILVSHFITSINDTHSNL